MAIDFNPQLARTLARDNMMTDAAYKSGVMGGDLSTLKKIKDKISQLRQNRGEKMADNKWFPGKFLMQGLGGATGLAQSIPGAVKNITNKYGQNLGNEFKKGQEGGKGLLDFAQGGTGTMDLSFDMNDPESVKALQTKLGVTADGMFGPKTEAAYREAMNAQRMGQGLDAFTYGNNQMPVEPVEPTPVEPVMPVDDVEPLPDFLGPLDPDNFQGPFVTPNKAGLLGIEPDSTFLDKMSAAATYGDPSQGSSWQNFVRDFKNAARYRK